jgi:uncharacterized protein (DUF2252 family)
VNVVGTPRDRWSSGAARASVAERTANGKALRDRVPRSEQGEWTFDARREGFVRKLEAAVAGRRPDLLPWRWRRMAESPFAFLRATAALMAADLGPVATCGIAVQACGDAHLLNLGAYAAPDGHLVFDLNDFDETCRGPFEWDLKRLAASFVVAGRVIGQSESACASAVCSMVEAYRSRLARLSPLPTLELARFEVTPHPARRPLAPIFTRAARNTPRQLLAKATVPGAGGLARFQDDAPRLVPLGRVAGRAVIESLSSYRETLGAAPRQVLDAYTPWDAASKVTGTGSVGVDDYLVLLYGNGRNDPLFLQIKEEDASCWQPYLKGGGARPANPLVHHGRRVAEGQLRMQTVADPMLGWTELSGRHFLVRQWSDHKASLDVKMLADGTMAEYAVVCGEVLAKAHARTGDAAMLAGYCGRSDRLDVAVARFAAAYAEQVEADHARFRKAVRKGELRTPRKQS